MATRIIGLTGGIGAGKSVVSRVLRGRGYMVFDCDLEAKRLMENDPELRFALSALCGDEVYSESGSLNRSLLASLIFNDEEKRGEVNRLVHSAVRREFLFQAAADEDLFFVEAAIMASSGLARLCSEVWFVDAAEEIRFRRALERGGIEEGDLKSRMEVQKEEFSLLDRLCVGVRVIDNSGPASVLDQLNDILSDSPE